MKILIIIKTVHAGNVSVSVTSFEEPRPKIKFEDAFPLSNTTDEKQRKKELDMNKRNLTRCGWVYTGQEYWSKIWHN